MFCVVFGVIRMSSLLHVDGLCRRSDAQIQATRALRSVHGGGMVMGIWGFWIVDGLDGIIVVIVAVVIMAVVVMAVIIVAMKL